MKRPYREKISREIRVLIQPTLHEQFQKKCSEEYKTVSEVIRDLVLQWLKGEK